MSNDGTKKMGEFFGKLFAFNNSLKLYHWHVTGQGSYAQHMALDEAIDTLRDTLDRVVETSYALYGDIEIVIPQTPAPSDIVEHAKSFYAQVKEERDIFDESFSDSIIDEYQEAIQQLLYRLIRLQ